jgi:predicted nucleic acid-binding protein
MSGERFTLDTNILVYCIDSSAGERHRLAGEIVERSAPRNCVLTLQAVSEFFTVALRKIPKREAVEAAEDWLEFFPCVAASAAAVKFAIAHSAAGEASYWDALLVATAAEAGCAAILTEDMADGGQLGSVRIHNPFDRRGGLSAAARALLEST